MAKPSAKYRSRVDAAYTCGMPARSRMISTVAPTDAVRLASVGGSRPRSVASSIEMLAWTVVITVEATPLTAPNDLRQRGASRRRKRGGLRRARIFRPSRRAAAWLSEAEWEAARIVPPDQIPAVFRRFASQAYERTQQS